ncbi:MAG TPA: hypothetical protein VFO27_03520 [Bryobacteraceae bacterium]|nr:hypothetical protein [Bryobacteraceae bacterium]
MSRKSLRQLIRSSVHLALISVCFSTVSHTEGRAKRVKQFHIHAISAENRRRFADAWRADQARFVDEPEQAVAEAHELVSALMRARGYPVSTEFQQNAADLSVDHPGRAQNGIRFIVHHRLTSSDSLTVLPNNSSNNSL